MDSPLVSVIMPTYNRRDLIVLAIDSVVAQSYQNWELLVVDDGSVDKTDELLKERYAGESRIKYLYQKNAGQSSARNQGIATSIGEYIAFLDSDNLWEPNRLAAGVEVLRKNANIGLCFADSISIDIQGRELGRENMRRYSGKVFPLMVIDNFVSMNTVLVRRSIFYSDRPFNQANRLDEDYELWLDLSVNNEYFYIPHFLSRYRVEGNRVSDNFMRRLDANEATVKKIIAKYDLDMSDPDLKMGLAKHYLRRASVVGMQGQLGQCFRELLRANKFHLLFARSLRIFCKSLLHRIGGIR